MLSASNTCFLRRSSYFLFSTLQPKRDVCLKIIFDVPCSDNFETLSEKRVSVFKDISGKEKVTLLSELNDGVFTVTINRPSKLNSLSGEVLQELDETFDEINNNPKIEIVIITGAGGKAFVGGADIPGLENLSRSEARELSQKGQELFNKIENCAKPVIAAVDGFAVGGGCELLMACHLIIASEKSKFGQPEVNLGLIPAFGGTQRLTRKIGKTKALELMMTADFISADEAKNLGLINHVVPSDQVLSKSIELAKKIQKKALPAIAKIIACANEAERGDPDGYKNEAKRFGDCVTTPESREGINAFLTKRTPNFTRE